MRTAEQFWARVELVPFETCWLWNGASSSNGYGRVLWRGEVRPSHRVAYELGTGPIPEGLDIGHHCDNPPCVRPSHLFPCTHTENMRDMSNKRRSGAHRNPAMFAAMLRLAPRPKGEHHNKAKLTNETVLEVRRRHDAGEGTTSLAKFAGVSANNMRKILRRQSWTHI